jgi:hypothetical protein
VGRGISVDGSRRHMVHRDLYSWMAYKGVVFMNERIRELAEQAGITTNLDTDFFEKDINKWVDYYSEKFAELIVRECTQIVADAVDHRESASTYAGKIQEHFGIK